MLIRDSGVIQLFVENAQEAYDVTVMAPRIAEHPDVLLPVLVCQDGFTITHAAEPVELLPDDAARAFVGDYRLVAPLLDVQHPVTHGPFAMPDYYYELRRQQTAAIMDAIPAIDDLADELARLTGRRFRCLEPYRLDEAGRAVVALGSTAGTIKDALDEVDGVGLVELHAFRPFPAAQLRQALAGIDEAVVLDRADSPGGAPPLYAEVAAALYGSGVELTSFVYGLGGRELHPEDVRALLAGESGAYVGLRSRPCPA
jgi:pyruvate ferredoxin oxidoreductase alpha subunit